MVRPADAINADSQLTPSPSPAMNGARGRPGGGRPFGAARMPAAAAHRAPVGVAAARTADPNGPFRDNKTGYLHLFMQVSRVCLLVTRAGAPWRRACLPPAGPSKL